MLDRMMGLVEGLLLFKLKCFTRRIAWVFVLSRAWLASTPQIDYAATGFDSVPRARL